MVCPESLSQLCPNIPKASSGFLFLKLHRKIPILERYCQFLDHVLITLLLPLDLLLLGIDMEDEGCQDEVSIVECPIMNHGDNGDNISEQRDGNSNEYNEIADQKPKPTPYQWWKFGIINLVQLKLNGWEYYRHAMVTHDSTVFKVKFDEWTTIVCDHVGMKSVLDLNKVKRDDTGLGFLDFKPDMMRQHIPCLWSNDEMHEIKKEFLVSFIKDIHENVAKAKMVEVIQKEFEKMSPISSSNDNGVDLGDIESIFINAAHNIVSYMLLGEYLENPPAIYEWKNTVFRKVGLLFGSAENTIEMTNKVFDMFKSIKKMKNLSSKFEASGLNENDLYNEVLFMTCGNAFPGIEIYTMNSLLCYIRLSESDKLLLKEDAEKFFAADCYDDVLPTLQNIHAFYMEVLRVHPIPVIYGRAKKDFLMKSTSGTFDVKENDLLCGMPYYVHRDPNLFEDPNDFNMHRPVKQTEKYNFTYGGYYYGKAGGNNHKCAGDILLVHIIKIIIMFYTKCTFVPAEVPTFTGKNIVRKFGSDEPLKLLEFVYKHSE